jgi:hypothetical protein
MQWQEIRKHFPHQWLLIEATKAHTEKPNKRILDDISIINTFPDSEAAWDNYTELHRKYPQREFYILHTDKKNLDITESIWLGIRPGK